MNKNLLKFIICASIPIIILIGMIMLPLITIICGQEITIQTRPVDPRDIFRGDYVQLAYNIENIDFDKFSDEIKNTRRSHDEYQTYYDFSSVKNKTLYAILKPSGNYYEVEKVTLKKPSEGIYLKCKVPSYFSTSTIIGSDDIITVNYNLDKFFVPENTGTDLETAARKGELLAKVKVYKGYAVIEDIFPGEANTNLNGM